MLKLKLVPRSRLPLLVPLLQDNSNNRLRSLPTTRLVLAPLVPPWVPPARRTLIAVRPTPVSPRRTVVAMSAATRPTADATSTDAVLTATVVLATNATLSKST